MGKINRVALITKFVLIFFLLLTIQKSYAFYSDNNTASYHYSGDLSFNPEAGYIEVNWKISVLTPEENNITFLLRSTLNEIKVHGEHVSSFSINKSELGDEFKKIEITLKPSLKKSSRIFYIQYQGVLLPLPMSNQINQISSSAIELNVDSFWLPMDYRFNQLLTAELNIAIDKSWQMVGSGKINEKKNGYSLVNNIPALDISFALAKDFTITQKASYSLFDLRKNQLGIDKLISSIDFCLTQLNSKYGKNSSVDNVQFVINERPSSGYARKGYIALTNIKDTPPERLTQFVCHEIAHNWSSKGKFDTEENWLNEAFAEYVGMMMLRERFGQQAFDERVLQFQEQLKGKKLAPIWTAETTSRPEYLVSYRKAPLTLLALENMIGSVSFERFITLYMTNSTSSTEQLLQQLLQVSDRTTQRWFVQELAK